VHRLVEELVVVLVMLWVVVVLVMLWVVLLVQE